jgi:hypothetical protein
MKPMTVGEIAAAARGEILLTGADASRRIGQVSTDTRTLKRAPLRWTRFCIGCHPKRGGRPPGISGVARDVGERA